MTYDNFKDYIRDKCNYETIYSDGEGRVILVITLLDAYAMTHRAPKKWVGLTDIEATDLWEGIDDRDSWEFLKQVEKKLKEKNNG